MTRFNYKFLYPSFPNEYLSNLMYTFLKSCIPDFLIDYYRNLRKKRLRKSIESDQVRGISYQVNDLRDFFIQAGIRSGDALMVHASLSKIGAIEGGASTVVEALKSIVGPEGLILMPTSPISKLQLEYVHENPIFDVKNTPSAMGAISEAFRISEGVSRSLHPTEPVAAWGKKATFFIEDHHLAETPYHDRSPYKKLMDAKGKILYIGVSLDNAGTHLHTLEDAIDVGLPIYCEQTFELRVQQESGQIMQVRTKVHNPDFSRRRQCNGLLPMFKAHEVYESVSIGKAETLVFDAHKMFQVMMDAFKSSGVTMYNPKGNS